MLARGGGEPNGMDAGVMVELLHAAATQRALGASVVCEQLEGHDLLVRGTRAARSATVGTCSSTNSSIVCGRARADTNGKRK
eukprot:13708167-Alexandrium_andersonii.AAC.1